MERELDPFERWMVKSNLEHAKIKGLKVVVAQLRANGYSRVANAVESEGELRREQGENNARTPRID